MYYSNPEKFLDEIEFQDFLENFPSIILKKIPKDRDIYISVLLSFTKYLNTVKNIKLNIIDIRKNIILYNLPTSMKYYISAIMLNILEEFKQSLLSHIYFNEHYIISKSFRKDYEHAD